MSPKEITIKHLRTGKQRAWDNHISVAVSAASAEQRNYTENWQVVPAFVHRLNRSSDHLCIAHSELWPIRSHNLVIWCGFFLHSAFLYITLILELRWIFILMALVLLLSGLNLFATFYSKAGRSSFLQWASFTPCHDGSYLHLLPAERLLFWKWQRVHLPCHFSLDWFLTLKRVSKWTKLIHNRYPSRFMHCGLSMRMQFWTSLDSSRNCPLLGVLRASIKLL